MLGALRERAGGRTQINFAEFMEVALYDPALGYYRKDEHRIGYAEGTDFVTATSSAPLFGKLVSAACVKLLGSADAGIHEFVEIGAERASGILSGVEHPFRSSRLVGVGEPINVSGPAIVFSNELFDAQPFRRFRKAPEGWRELGVSIGRNELAEVALPSVVPSDIALPADAPEGYVFDAPLASAALAGSIAEQPWNGLFVAFDYGKTWEELAHNTPVGTARSYRRHVQGNDLLAFPGGQDLTCHVCWDWIGNALSGAGFISPKVESQEAFFIHHAGSYIERIMASQGASFSREKLSLMQLLHPSNMGQKFQALWCRRENIPVTPSSPLTP
ncbi:MAG TPA: SAM-dependent methyltransferase [Opitutaceae bacterium]|jgi:SAM-dependent MidA family methyltransferase|nr:SAM-dependent methyltransferase [Opitutaceae bacterium]